MALRVARGRQPSSRIAAPHRSSRGSSPSRPSLLVLEHCPAPGVVRRTRTGGEAKSAGGRRRRTESRRSTSVRGQSVHFPVAPRAIAYTYHGCWHFESSLLPQASHPDGCSGRGSAEADQSGSKHGEERVALPRAEVAAVLRMYRPVDQTEQREAEQEGGEEVRGGHGRDSGNLSSATQTSDLRRGDAAFAGRPLRDGFLP